MNERRVGEEIQGIRLERFEGPVCPCEVEA